MIGQLLGGVFVGPYFLEMTGFLDKLHIHGYHAAFESFHYIIFAFLGVIAFALGEELHFDRLKKVGKNAAIISMIQGLLTWVLLTAFCRFAGGFDWIISLVIGSIGVATAPAITVILMNNLDRGSFSKYDRQHTRSR
jgi:Kef-type K+ transport system membrane component KefB